MRRRPRAPRAVPAAGAPRYSRSDAHVALCGRAHVRVRGRERPLQLLGVDDYVGVGQLAELEQLRIGEGGLGGAAAADDDDLLDLALAQRLQRVICRVGNAQLVVGEHEHARDVERDVAVADHDRAPAGEVEVVLGEVGVGVVPADEVHGRVRAGQLLTGYAERAVAR